MCGPYHSDHGPDFPSWLALNQTLALVITSGPNTLQASEVGPGDAQSSFGESINKVSRIAAIGIPN